MRVRLALSLATVAAVTACSGRGTGKATTVGVAAADTSCTIDRSEVPAGAVELAVTNHGTIVTEVYLYGAHGRVVGEIESVEPGARRSFTVTAGGGSYEVACKPGQVGDGIRAPLRITGAVVPLDMAPADEATARGTPAFGFEVRATTDRFASELSQLTVVRGQTVTFRLHNEANASRALAVLAPDGSLAGATAIAPPGTSVSASVTFEATGTYTAIDPVADHRAHGAETTFRVVD